MMFLAIDIGNTGAKFGLFKNEEPFEMTFRFPTAQIITLEHIEDELLPKLTALGNLSRILIASVVREATASLAPLLMRIHPEAQIELVKHDEVPIGNTYRDPMEVGIDRLIAAFAAYEKWGKKSGQPVIVISFGTATTIDCVNASGEYLGGIITLGVESGAKHLSTIAAQLPKIELAFPKNILGRTTVESIRSGIMNGAVAMIEGLVERMRREVFGNNESIVVATGGLSQLFEGRTSVINYTSPHLVLEGIAMIATSV
jgi:type III pantothenate kinase